jgi:hypothetical protein
MARGSVYDPENGVGTGTGGFAPPDVLGEFGTMTLTELDPPKSRPAATATAYLLKPVIPIAGYGGWSRVARPRKKAITEWVGRDSMSLEIEFMFDTYAEREVLNRGLYIEDQIRDLERMAGIDEDDPEPPLLEITSNPEKLIPHNAERASHVKWFIESLTWDKDSIISLNSGNRVRAAGTAVITQFVEDEILQQTVAQRRGNTTPKRGAKRKTYTVKKGDTLSKIAARKDVYGNGSQWRKIAKANHIRDPKHLKIGKKLKIP